MDHGAGGMVPAALNLEPAGLVGNLIDVHGKLRTKLCGRSRSQLNSLTHHELAHAGDSLICSVNKHRSFFVIATSAPKTCKIL